MTEYVEKNLTVVRDTLARAEQAAGRVGKTTLIAAVKYADEQELDTLLSLGVSDVGENRVQQLLAHLPLYEAYAPRVHFIGTLQKNKIKYIIDKVYAVHSVDSTELALELERHAAKHDLILRVFVEVNIGREPAKGGVMPEQAEVLCREIEALPHLALQGLMTMAPHCERAEEYRPYFKAARRLAEQIWHTLGKQGEPQLSMGMSESFPEAVAEGASLVRVGRRLFLKEEQ
ncbi:MAG: YggS family pyridoxal phosphate-dependent enzyme [Ruminococcaceae bacterium]|nr:YggS family pyridoxal phosphate-dependent enzyme [Oscillospiraceae bacterium]MBQ2758040.1 YggS family pyridoxal phosphate-dependent enzyme [Clostridia bacterium]